MRIDKIAFVDQSTTLRVCTYSSPLEIDRSKPNLPRNEAMLGRRWPLSVANNGGKLGRDQLPPPYQSALPSEQSFRGAFDCAQ